MKKILVCSDLHGMKKTFTKIFQEENARQKIDAVMIAGDMEIGRDEILEITDPVPVYAVLGNNDYGIDWPKTSYFNFGGHRFMLTHGHLFGGPVIGRLQEAAEENNADIVIFGHTHRQYEYKLNEIRYYNPGAVLGCRDTGKPGYMILTIGDDNEVSAQFARIEKDPKRRRRW